jgi:hypothetical protein
MSQILESLKKEDSHTIWVKKYYLSSAYYMPSILLSVSYTFTHLISIKQPHKIDTIIL